MNFTPKLFLMNSHTFIQHENNKFVIINYVLKARQFQKPAHVQLGPKKGDYSITGV